MALVSEMRPATRIEEGMFTHRLNYREIPPQTFIENIDLLKKVVVQLRESGATTLVFKGEDGLEAKQVENMIRTMFAVMEVPLETSMLKDKKRRKILLTVGLINQ